MNNYNLITDAEKSLVSDSHAWSNLIVAEYNKPNGGDGERRKQLVEFKKEHTQSKNVRIIQMKADSMNELEYHKSVLIERFNDVFILGKKVLKVDDSFMEKFKDFFKIESIEEGKGTTKGKRITGYVKSQYGFLTVMLSAYFWENGESINSSLDFRIYELESDKQTVKAIHPNTLDPFIDAEEEIRKAKLYFDFVKESEEKASELKKACNYIMLDVIKNRI